MEEYMVASVRLGLKRRFLRVLPLLGVPVLWSMMLSTASANDLMVYPTRVVFEGQRSAQVDLVNTGSEPSTYSVTVERRRMNEDGSLTSADGAALPGELFVDEMVRFSPRSITLAPGGGQTVRLMLRKPDSLAPGEYRSHLVFTKMPNPSAAATVPEQAGLQTRLIASVNITLPLIVRHGELSAAAGIEGIQYRAGDAGTRPEVAFTLSRKGTRSLYGDITVTCGGRPVGVARGVAVYVPNDKRSFRIPLAASFSAKSGEKILVSFVERGGGSAASAKGIAAIP